MTRIALNALMRYLKLPNKQRWTAQSVLRREMSAMGKRYRQSTQFPTKFNQNAEYMAITSEESAQLLLKHISPDLANDTSIIFESSPGFGVLTELLLKSGAQAVRVFEHDDQHLQSLHLLQHKYGDRLQIHDKQILDLPKLWYKCSEVEEKIIDSWFAGVAVTPWKSSPPIKFVGTLSPQSSVTFFRFVTRQVINFGDMFRAGRIQFLVFLNGNEVEYMRANPCDGYHKYRSSSVFYQTLFDIEVLEAVPVTHFTLYNMKQPKKTKNSVGYYLVRITPKESIVDYERDLFIDYHKFVSQTFMKRKQWIIPYLENWFPNCGPELIKMGIPVFKYFGDLPSEQMLQLFLHFYHSDDYENSLFKSVISSHSHSDDELDGNAVDPIKEPIEVCD